MSTTTTTTTPPIASLPAEVLFQILHRAALLALRENPTYTYGLSRCSAGLDKSPVAHLVLGAAPSPDARRWAATGAIRRVSRSWSAWACRWALGTLFVCKGKGGERFVRTYLPACLAKTPSLRSFVPLLLPGKGESWRELTMNWQNSKDGSRRRCWLLCERSRWG